MLFYGTKGAKKMTYSSEWANRLLHIVEIALRCELKQWVGNVINISHCSFFLLFRDRGGNILKKLLTLPMLWEGLSHLRVKSIVSVRDSLQGIYISFDRARFTRTPRLNGGNGAEEKYKSLIPRRLSTEVNKKNFRLWPKKDPIELRPIFRLSRLKRFFIGLRAFRCFSSFVRSLLANSDSLRVSDWKYLLKCNKSHENCQLFSKTQLSKFLRIFFITFDPIKREEVLFRAPPSNFFARL